VSSRFGLSACLVAAAGLAACAVGPDFKRPETPAPAVYRVPEESPASAEGRVLTASESTARAPAQHFISGADPADEWWTAFASRDLDAVVREAVARNHTLAAAQATVAEARELVKAQAGNLYPQVSFAAGAGRQKYGTEFLGPLINNLPPFSYVRAGVAVQYRVDYTGGIARSVEQREALAQYQRSEADATSRAFVRPQTREKPNRLLTCSMKNGSTSAQVRVTRPQGTRHAHSWRS